MLFQLVKLRKFVYEIRCEVAKIIFADRVKDLVPGRALGVDGITPSMMQEGWALLSPVFHQLCLGYLELGFILSSWRELNFHSKD